MEEEDVHRIVQAPVAQYDLPKSFLIPTPCRVAVIGKKLFRGLIISYVIC